LIHSKTIAIVDSDQELLTDMSSLCVGWMIFYPLGWIIQVKLAELLSVLRRWP